MLKDSTIDLSNLSNWDSVDIKINVEVCSPENQFKTISECSSASITTVAECRRMYLSRDKARHGKSRVIPRQYLLPATPSMRVTIKFFNNIIMYLALNILCVGS